MTRSLELSADLARPYVIVACALAALSFALLLVELFRASRTGRVALFVASSGALAVLGLLAAVLRPVAINSHATLMGPRVVVLIDASRSIDLPGIEGTRRETIDRALAELGKRNTEVRYALLGFGDGAPKPLQSGGKSPETGAPAGSFAPSTPPPPHFTARPLPRSDLSAALEAVAKAPDERPSALVVLSDGRLDRPGVEATGDATRAALVGMTVPVHTVALATSAPADASIRAVTTAGAAVAHQPFSLRIEVGCDGGLSCDDVPVAARELREQGAPTPLASGKVHMQGATGTVDLTVTLDRAGARILEVEIEAPPGDAIRDNDKRYVTIDVTRDRVRVLHVAGRPTYDVRALRMWLKADASVDVVAFFILRTPNDDVVAPQDELALIPFPVDELFDKHLPSFDAVVLQDFNAKPYGLERHLPSLARYVEKGGGLIMVGGPDAFVAGNYAGTRLAEVLPVELDRSPDAPGADLGTFVPRMTEPGRVAPVLSALRSLIGEELPPMPGTNIVGDARRGATVLLTHPTRTTKSGAPMPVLSLGENGSGRTIALSIDGSHRLLFSAFAAAAAGRAHGAFWDAMLGWLMRDPRFEPATIDLPGGCIAGEETTLVLRPLPGAKGDGTVTITRLGTGAVVRTEHAEANGEGGAIEVPIGRLEPGGYSATVEIGQGESKGPTTRRDFACEKGGDEWADTRPDVERLRAIANATGGTSVVAGDIGSLPLPPAIQVSTERHVAPLLPPWAWTLGAAVVLGAHWIVRRRGGLV